MLLSLLSIFLFPLSGLRCIHCKHLPVRERVKRAVCYPSAVGRIYNSCSDMKFDHFSHCKSLPLEVKAKLAELKQEESKNKSSNSNNRRENKKSQKNFSYSTAQYYHDSARKMDMVDCKSGVFMNRVPASSQTSSQKISPACYPSTFAGSTSVAHRPSPMSMPPQQAPATLHFPTITKPENDYPNRAGLIKQHQKRTTATSIAECQSMLTPFLFSLLASNANALAKTSLQHNQQQQQPRTSQEQQQQPVPSKTSPPPPCKISTNNLLLASPADQQHLNALHCFVRRQLEVFQANEHDITTPAPGRKTRINIGQVGIRCIWCAQLPPKERVKRAVCYPPSLSGVYHSVSNMKYDHFENCRGLPPQVRAEFTSLRSSAGRKSVPGVSQRGSANSTAHYYYESAARLGLVDTEKGIRFLNNEVESKKTESSASPMKLAGEKARNTEPVGIAALMIAATDPSVREAYLQSKAPRRNNTGISPST